MKITLIDCEEYPDNAARMAMSFRRRYPGHPIGQRNCILFTIDAGDFGMGKPQAMFAVWRTKGGITVQRSKPPA